MGGKRKRRRGGWGADGGKDKEDKGEKRGGSGGRGGRRWRLVCDQRLRMPSHLDECRYPLPTQGVSAQRRRLCHHPVPAPLEPLQQ